ncbi:hypothetical protein EDB19DRAFT_1834881 [Suillus lakei]|nr:hypothetical protein EDB19DRAFT_1834881 [Suillus lakei]
MDTIDSEAQQILMVRMYATLAGNSILIYDHVTTLPEEIAFIWRRPKALSAMLFLLNRYFALLGNICQLVRQIAVILQAVIVCLIMTIRTYALYGGSKRLLASMTTIMIALAIAVSVGSLGHFSGDVTIVPGVGCNETYTAETYAILFADLHAYLKVVAEPLVSEFQVLVAYNMMSRPYEIAGLGLAWLAELIFELLVFILIVYRICKTRGLLRLSLVTRRNLIDIIFLDGAMYFGAMALVNIPNILMYYVEFPDDCISVTLISRLMLNLHKSINAGIFSITAQDDGPSLAVLTTRVNEWTTLHLRRRLGVLNTNLIFGRALCYSSSTRKTTVNCTAVTVHGYGDQLYK